MVWHLEECSWHIYRGCCSDSDGKPSLRGKSGGIRGVLLGEGFRQESRPQVQELPCGDIGVTQDFACNDDEEYPSLTC